MIYGISLRDNKEQQELARLIEENNKAIILCTGDAGTGKTMISIATALELQKSKKFKNIIYTRNPIEVGQSMGFLKGNLDEKFGPYIAPLMDNLEAIERVSNLNVNANDLVQKIIIEPVAFMRGRSFENSIIIVDEAQNLDLTALKTLLTRVNGYSKIILLGSMNQIDDKQQRKKSECDFKKVIDKLVDLPYVGYVHLIKSMRSPWCAEVDKLLSEIEEENETKKPKTKIIGTIGDGINEDRITVSYLD